MSVSGQEGDDILRLLECWLPLAQELNESQGWGDDARSLELLILAARPALRCVSRLDAARAVLMVYHACRPTAVGGG